MLAPPRRLLAASIAAIPLVLLIASPSATVNAGAATSPPNVIILGTAIDASFHPSVIKAPPTNGTCTSNNYSVSITNKSHATQRLTERGRPFEAAMPFNGVNVVCGSSGTFTLGLRHSKSRLRVTIT